jgi:hypothetical protein
MPSIEQVEENLNSHSSSSLSEAPDAVTALLALAQAQKEKTKPDTNRAIVFNRLEKLALELQNFESNLEKSKVPNFLSFKAKNAKVINKVCTVAENAVNAYLDYEIVSAAYLKAKAQGEDADVEAVNQKAKAANDALNTLTETANNLPSQKAMRRTGIAKMALGAALILISTPVFAALACAAGFMPPVSAIFAYCAGASLVSGIGFFAGGFKIVSSANRNTGLPSLSLFSNNLDSQFDKVGITNKAATSIFAANA